MDRKICILHRSTIVRNGLSEMIHSYFKCPVTTFENLEAFSNDKDLNKYSIIIVSSEIAGTESFLRFQSNPSTTNILKLTFENPSEQSTESISIYDSSEEILEKLNSILSQHEIELSSENNSEELTRRETDVLSLVALGHSNKEIADKLFISTHTVISHRKNITEKLGIKSISGLTVYAIINNIIDTSDLDVNDLI